MTTRKKKIDVVIAAEPLVEEDELIAKGPPIIFWERWFTPKIRHYLTNGGRIQVATLIIVFGMAILLVSDLFTSSNTTPVVLKNDVPQIVLNVVVDGLPQVEQEGVLLVQATKCNITNKTVTLEATNGDIKPSFVRQDGERIKILVERLDVGNTIRTPGCITPTFGNKLPSGVIPGIWRLEGADRPIGGQIEPWYTQNFRVVEKAK